MLHPLVLRALAQHIRSQIAHPLAGGIEPYMAGGPTNPDTPGMIPPPPPPPPTAPLGGDLSAPPTPMVMANTPSGPVNYGTPEAGQLAIQGLRRVAAVYGVHSPQYRQAAANAAGVLGPDVSLQYQHEYSPEELAVTRGQMHPAEAEAALHLAAGRGRALAALARGRAQRLGF